jgi:hypothetical protein
MGLAQKWAVKVVGAYVIFGWVLMDILYFGVWCRPFNQYWAVPVENSKCLFLPRRRLGELAHEPLVQCSAAINHLIVNATLNVSSDIMMLCIPLPLLINSTLPPLKLVTPVLEHLKLQSNLTTTEKQFYVAFSAWVSSW